MEHFLGVEQSYVKTFFCLKKKNCVAAAGPHKWKHFISRQEEAREQNQKTDC